MDLRTRQALPGTQIAGKARRDLRNLRLPLPLTVTSLQRSMDDVLDKLTEYVLALSDALASTQNANDRPALPKHPAASAQMFALLRKHRDVSAIEDLLNSEIRRHGWSYIAAPCGEKIAGSRIALTKAAGVEQ